MKARLRSPLSEPQQRRLTVALAGLERLLAEVRHQLEQAPPDLRLTRFENRLEPAEAAGLQPGIHSLETRLRRMADELGLSPMTESVRRGLVAGLELASIHLQECRPESGLKGYGPVAPEAARYLDRELPKLEAELRQLAARVGRGNPSPEPETHG